MADQLVIPVLTMADKMGVPSPTAVQRDQITDWMLDAQADVEDFLNRSIFPFEVTREGVWKDTRYPDTDYRAWPWVLDEYDDEFAVVSAAAQGDGTWNVTLRIGLDGAGTRGIVAYVTQYVLDRARQDERFPSVERPVKSVSAEGQSLSWVEPSKAAGQTGEGPTLDKLKRHRRNSARRARSRTAI